MTCAICGQSVGMGEGQTVCAKCLKVAPMRMITERKCGECGHEWKQPAATGRCPNCHSEQTVNVSQRPCGLKRIR